MEPEVSTRIITAGRISRMSGSCPLARDTRRSQNRDPNRIEDIRFFSELKEPPGDSGMITL